eukprot:354852-Chlamydomonas_euryale.AAC.6
MRLVKRAREQQVMGRGVVVWRHEFVAVSHLVATADAFQHVEHGCRGGPCPRLPPARSEGTRCCSGCCCGVGNGACDVDAAMRRTARPVTARLRSVACGGPLHATLGGIGWGGCTDCQYAATPHNTCNTALHYPPRPSSLALA